jgi:hypothetical protein
MTSIFAKVEYLDQKLHQSVKKEADSKFGAENSYVKNLWVLKEYKKKGGKTKYSGEKPSKDKVSKQVKGEVDINDDFFELMDEFESLSLAAEKKTLNKPFRTPGGPKKFSVYVKNDKGNIVKVNFGDPNATIKRSDPERRKSFRARHKCDQKNPKWKARYWSCKMWSSKPVSSIASVIEDEWDGETLANQEELLKDNPSLASVEEIDCECCCEDCQE